MLCQKSDSGGNVYVFLYFTKAGASGTDGTISSCEPVGNRLYRYEWINDQLVNPKLLLDLPAIPGPCHNGGVVTIGPDNNVYVIIGDVDGHKTQAQNQESGEEPDETSGILRITQDGQWCVESYLTSDPLELLLIGKVPLREPITRYGPFVMNTQQEINQAIEEYRSGRLG